MPKSAVMTTSVARRIAENIKTDGLLVGYPGQSWKKDKYFLKKLHLPSGKIRGKLEGLATWKKYFVL
jgi:hypothetical protein